MPLGLISDDDFLKELNNSSVPDISGLNRDQLGEIKEIKKGKPEGTKNVPEGLRKIIGETANLEGRQEGIKLAEEFGISSYSADAYSNGATSLATYNKPDENLKNFIDNSKLKAGKKASVKLLKALHHLTEDKLENAKATDLAVIAKAMSGIVKDMEPDSSGGNQGQNGPTIVLYAPRVMKESTFDIINVKE